MILKTMRKKKYDLKDATESVETYEINFIGNIKSVNKVYNYNEMSTSLGLYFNDDSSQIFLLSEKEDNAEKMLYENVFLLNDKGETIERLI